MVFHIDGNPSNSYYKNLMYVDRNESYALRNGNMKVEDIMDRQKYIEFATGYRRAISIYNGIFLRTVKTNEKAYCGATLCDKWLKNPDSFLRWYEKNYYDCDGENMAVDKDLLCKGNKEYSPDKCVILPQTLNVMLSNCKKSYDSKPQTRWGKREPTLPLGVSYNSSKKKYYGMFSSCGGKTIQLNYWDTAEEAFQEYKKHKQADILIMADLYKSKVPDKVYQALINYEVEPY